MSRPTFADVVRCIEGRCQAARPTLMCGCGNQGAALFVWLRDYLTASDAGSNMCEHGGYPPVVAAVVAHAMDEAGMLEHGGLWYWAWPGARGRATLAVLASMTDEDIATAYYGAITPKDMDHDPDGGETCPVCGGRE